jgi:hypothetical protein
MLSQQMGAIIVSSSSDPLAFPNPLLANDGNWLCRGYAAMFVNLDPTTQEKIQQQNQQQQQD